MKFTFRFASVLKLRRHQEKVEKQKLASLFSHKAELQDQLMNLQHQCQRGATDSSTQTVVANRQHYAQQHQWHKRMADIRLQISELENNIETQRLNLAKANMQTRKMQKLREHEKKTFIEHIEKMDQLQQNEIAIQRYNAN